MKQQLDILMVDDHESIALGVQTFLEKNFCGHFNSYVSGVSALKHMELFLYDLYIIDLELQDMDGIELIDKLRELHPEAKIIVFTMREGVWDIKRLLKKNINGIVLKASPLAVLKQAIDNVLCGNSYCCRRFKHISQANNELYADSYLLDCKITSIEKTIIQLASKGYSSRQIAEYTNRSIHTIVDYRKQLFDKFDVRSMEELLVIAVSNKFPLENT